MKTETMPNAAALAARIRTISMTMSLLLSCFFMSLHSAAYAVLVGGPIGAVGGLASLRAARCGSDAAADRGAQRRSTRGDPDSEADHRPHDAAPEYLSFAAGTLRVVFRV